MRSWSKRLACQSKSGGVNQNVWNVSQKVGELVKNLKSQSKKIDKNMIQGSDWQPQDPFQDDWRAQGEEQPLELVTRRHDPGK